MKATFNNKIIAESNDTISHEGTTYFPHQSIKKEYFKPSKINSICNEKGIAQYYNIEVNGKFRDDAAWYYPEIINNAKFIENYVAFWKGIKIEK
ncbi:DUF427 domain-containing protein [Flavobacterium oreochromis]|uniref:DUF427 domain-containing protein n=1 Tax=Flavobacterium oreochromis TaxID=2906078 RepID=A0ABW8P9L0_9FLAO